MFKYLRKFFISINTCFRRGGKKLMKKGRENLGVINS